MPYIKPEFRPAYDEAMEPLFQLLKERGFQSGDINYCVSRLIWRSFEEMGGRYANANDLMGALECIKQEFYRRKVAPYEDLKIKENGDVG
ncbi:MAG: DUF6899 family protein [Verrucomicrobiales bacterium]